MRVVGLCSCSVQMNHGLWEGWWKDCALPHSFIRPGLPFLTAHITPARPDSYSPDPHGEPQHPVQAGLSKLWKCSLFMLLCGRPRQLETDLTWNAALTVLRKKKQQKNRRWKNARIHPHSHTTPILTRHQLDHFQEFWHFVSLVFTYGTLLRKPEVDQL